MKSNAVVVGLLIALLLPGAVQAETRIEAIARHLAEQGYTDIEISRTFLGRVQIEAEKNGMEREIIVNPRSGEILRDYWEDDGEHSLLGQSSNPPNTSENDHETHDADDGGGDD